MCAPNMLSHPQLSLPVFVNRKVMKATHNNCSFAITWCAVFC